MSSLKLKTPSGGSVSFNATDTANDVTLTVPASNASVITSADSGTITQGMLGSGVTGTGPAFSAYSTLNQTLSSGTKTKVIFDQVEWDTNSNFDNTSNYRFTPTIAGYYQFNAGVYYQASNNGFIMLDKNGATQRRLGGMQSGYGMVTGSAVLYMNGTTDYAELYAYDGGGTTINASSKTLLFFEAFLVRTA